MVIPADPACMVTVSEGVSALLETRNWPADEVMRVELALQEALSNAIRHGCKDDPRKQVQCCVTFAAGELVIVVRDPGAGFDPTAVPNPLEGTNVLKPSGRGVFLINELMDTVEYNDQGRQVVMTKRLDETHEAGALAPSR